MFRPRVIPVLLLQGKGLVKTVRFAKKKARYIGDPINAVRLFNELQADELVFLDITANLEGRTVALDLVRQIGDEAFMPFSVGGNVTDLRQVGELLKSGAEKVVLNTAACENPELIRSAAEKFGSQSIVAAIDVRKDMLGRFRVFSHSGSVRAAQELERHVAGLERLGAGEIMVNSMDRDGTMKGYDLELIRSVADRVSVPVIACGGAGTTADLAAAVSDGHASAAAAGSIFVYHGPRKAVLINYPERAQLRGLFAGAGENANGI